MVKMELHFSDDFFCPEERSGFLVPAMMKRAWAAAMEVLCAIDGVCRRHDIPYFADWGTLLGAIRHKGFIPWDDDIDICLKRADYRDLIRVLPTELPRGFVMTGMYAQSKRLQEAAFVPQLRVMADETFWDFNDYMVKFHGFPYQRIGIDVFPLDKLPSDMESVSLQREMIREGIVLLRDWEQLREAGELNECLKQYGSLCGVEIPQRPDIQNWMWKLVDAIRSLYEEDDLEEMTDYCANMGSPKPFCVRREWYDSQVYVPFEQIEIPVPVGYDGVLTAQFGDYMTPRRVTGGHDYPFYRHMEEELKRQIRAVGFQGDVEEFCQKVSSGQLRV